MRVALSSLIVSMSLCLTSCYSLMMERGTAWILPADSGAFLEVSYWRVLGYDAINGRGGPPPTLAGTILIGIVTWPVDVVQSSILGSIAVFDPDLGIAWGPLGALGGILVPGLTLSPYVMAPMSPRFLEIRIEPGEYSALMKAVRRGDHALCIEIIERHAGRGVRDLVLRYGFSAPVSVAGSGS